MLGILRYTAHRDKEERCDKKNKFVSSPDMLFSSANILLDLNILRILPVLKEFDFLINFCINLPFALHDQN